MFISWSKIFSVWRKSICFFSCRCLSRWLLLWSCPLPSSELISIIGVNSSFTWLALWLSLALSSCSFRFNSILKFCSFSSLLNNWRSILLIFQLILIPEVALLKHFSVSEMIFEVLCLRRSQHTHLLPLLVLCGLVHKRHRSSKIICLFDWFSNNFLIFTFWYWCFSTLTLFYRAVYLLLRSWCRLSTFRRNFSLFSYHLFIIFFLN